MNFQGVLMFGGRVMLASAVRIMWCHAEIVTNQTRLLPSLYPAISLPSRLLIREATRYSCSKEHSLLLAPKNTPFRRRAVRIARIVVGFVCGPCRINWYILDYSVSQGKDEPLNNCEDSV